MPLSVTKALLAENCRVVLADRNRDSMALVVKGTPSTAHKITSSLIVECDVTDRDQVKSLIEQADHFAANGNDDDNDDDNGGASRSMATLLVNCAGITRDNWISKMTLDEWNDVIDVNLKGTFFTCRAFLDQERMKRFQSLQSQLLLPPPTSIYTRPEGQDESFSIVNLGSIVSEYGNLGQANYAASKGGVLGLTRALAKESAKRNVRINAVLPGFIDTPMAQAVPDTVKEQVILPKIPMGRFGRPEEIADVVTFLLSPRSSYITGESIRVSGMISL